MTPRKKPEPKPEPFFRRTLRRTGGILKTGAALVLPYIITAACVLLVVFFLFRGLGFKCAKDEESETPAEIPAGEVLDDIPGDSDVRGLANLTTRNIRPARRGVVEAEATEEAEAFVAAALDSTLPPALPFVRGRYSDERLSLAVGRSDGSVLREDFDGCGEPCSFGADTSGLFAQEPRTLGRPPNVLKDAAVCLAFGGATYGVGRGIEAISKEPLQVDPLIVGAVGTSVCALVKIY